MTNDIENLAECTECGVICEPYSAGLGECEECFHEGCKEHGHPCADCLGTMIDRAMDMADMER